MSDSYYQEKAARRNRIIVIAAAVVAIIVCIVAGGMSLFYDACTKSFDRSPQAIITAYLDAVRRGELETAQECWEHEAFYDMEAGCSEICLSRAVGAQFEVEDLSLGSVEATDEGRSNLEVVVSIACSGDGQQHTAGITLDSVGGNPPWKHWSIVRSTFGGTVAEAWCQGE
jgi:hypothetical protein